MTSTNLNNARLSKNIVKGIVQEGPPRQSENDKAKFQKVKIKKIKNIYDEIHLKSKTSCNLTLEKIGLPENTFDDLIIKLDERQFRKSIQDLRRDISFPSDYSEIDLKTLKNMLIKDLKQIQHVKTLNTNKTIKKNDEIIKRNNEKDCYNLSNKDKTYYRSTSSISSRIPVPNKIMATQRCKSKLEQRIQRKFSVPSISTSQVYLTVKQNKRKGSLQGDDINCEELF